MIHNIDECCWTKNDWPIEAKACGGRHYRGDMVDQNFDVYDIEYTFPDGSKLLVDGRTMPGAYSEFASYAHGTKGSAVISTSGHTPAKCRIYKGQMIDDADSLAWAFPQPEQNPYQLEWDDLLKAIREDTPYNEVERGVRASLVTSMGRMAAHTGSVITYDEMLNVDHEFAPGIAELTLDSPLAAAGRRERPVSDPDAGAGEESGISHLRPVRFSHSGGTDISVCAERLVESNSGRQECLPHRCETGRSARPTDEEVIRMSAQLWPIRSCGSISPARIWIGGSRSTRPSWVAGREDE